MPLLLLLAELIAALLFVAQPDDEIIYLVPEVISVRPHDPTAYTQGLLLHEGLLSESTGQYGMSTLRQVDPLSGEVLALIHLPHYVFGEGLALVGDRLIQITWRERLALVYDRAGFVNDSLASVEVFVYEGEGWGLCYDGEWLYMTDGSDTLFRRDPDTFELQEQILVTRAGTPQGRLNELECVGDDIYANIYLTDEIVRIDKFSGRINAVIDASGLLTSEETAALGADVAGQTMRSLVYDSRSRAFLVYRQRLGSGPVLNGIAYDPDADTFLVTGKLWPSLFEVRFVPADE